MEDFHYSKVTINSHSAKALITTKTPVFIFFFNDPKRFICVLICSVDSWEDAKYHKTSV